MSVSVALALPSASSGIKPRVRLACLAGDSPLHCHVSESVVSVGTNTVSTGTAGRYFATKRAVLPPWVSTTMSAARTFCAVRTADDASDSSGAMGMGTCARILLKSW